MRHPSANNGHTVWRRGRRVLAAAAIVTVVLAGTAYAALVGLPGSGAQINNDGSAIDPAQSVDHSDLTTGSLTGAARIPWITFDQQAAGGGPTQVFARAFKSDGAWHDEGFPESLNNDTSQNADSPSIDFTGANRAVPWVGWAEATPSLGASQIFASRFVSSSGQNGGQWQQEGLGRATVPSLNINTNRNADLPALIGGTTVAGNNPAPWITWEEFDGQQGACNNTLCAPQIFVSHAAPNAPGCSKPTGSPLAGHNFCFQQVGLDRVISPNVGQKDPSLNIDPTRAGIEADIAFTGPNDTVPWVVWYENSDSNGAHPSQIGLQNQDMVFAAKAVADTTGDGGFHWQVVGLGTAGQTNPLDTTGATHGFGPCAESIPAENACSLNVTPGNNLSAGAGAENPSITAGTMVAGNKTTPWISWDENSSDTGQHSVFVARLDAAGDHYDLLNNGLPISHSGFNSTRSDIVFAGNTPYVSWHETDGSGQTVTVVGHFEGNPANPGFHTDTPSAGVPTTASSVSDSRAPIASTCPADPFTADGSACSGGAVGTPVFAYTNTASGPQALFAQGYTPDSAATGAASAATQTTATVAGTVATDGARTFVHFDYGTTVAYGASTAQQLVGPASGVSTPVSAALAALPPGTVIHYRVVAQTDFGTVAGADASFNTAAVPPPPPPPPPNNGTVGKTSINKVKVSGQHVSLVATCKGSTGQKCKLSFKLTIKETFKGRKLVAISTRKKVKTTHKTVTLGTKNLTLNAGKHRTVKVFLNGKGKGLLSKRHRLKVRLKGTQSLAKKKTKTVVNRTVTFKAPKKKHK